MRINLLVLLFLLILTACGSPDDKSNDGDTSCSQSGDIGVIVNKTTGKEYPAESKNRDDINIAINLCNSEEKEREEVCKQIEAEYEYCVENGESDSAIAKDDEECLAEYEREAADNQCNL